MRSSVSAERPRATCYMGPRARSVYCKLQAKSVFSSWHHCSAPLKHRRRARRCKQDIAVPTVRSAMNQTRLLLHRHVTSSWASDGNARDRHQPPAEPEGPTNDPKPSTASLLFGTPSVNAGRKHRTRARRCLPLQTTRACASHSRGSPAEPREFTKQWRRPSFLSLTTSLSSSSRCARNNKPVFLTPPLHTSWSPCLQQPAQPRGLQGRSFQREVSRHEPDDPEIWDNTQSRSVRRDRQQKTRRP